MKKTAILILLLCLFAANTAQAYPPDNAALVYYKCMVNFSRPEAPLGDQLRDAAKGKIKVSDEIQQYLGEKRLLIDALQTASEIPNCDWGLDFSQGLALKIPYLATMRQFTYIMLADAQLKKQEGQTQEAMDQCLVVLRMAGHVGNDTFISYLVGTAMTALTYDAIGDVLNVMGSDEKLLTELQRELERPEYNKLDLKPAMLNERRYYADAIMQMTPEKKKLLEEQVAPNEELKKDLPLLTEGSEEFLAASAEYYQQLFDKYIAALDQPYKQAITTFQELEKVPEKDYEAGKKEAFGSVLLAPATTKVCDIDIRRRTHQNALSAAIQLYRYYAKKGNLPDELPAAFPKDLFSGQPFEYEKTDTGFTLRCRQAEIEGKINEYTFKIAK